MTARNLLHISKLEEFKTWLDRRGTVHRPGRGYYEVLQVQLVYPHWCCIYRREDMPEHFTVDKRMTGTVRQFINSRHEPPPDAPITLESTEPCPTEPPWMI